METITVEREDGLVTVTLNRPESKNAINQQMWDELKVVFHEVAANHEDRALLLTGAGGNFSSGADLSGGMTESKPSEMRPIMESMREIGDTMIRLHQLPKPTIAKIDGVAVGVGLGMALACDLVVASDRARFYEIFPKRGLALDGGNSWALPRMVGLHKAKELAFFGDLVSAAEAKEIGLVNRVVPVDELDASAAEWARRLASGPTMALSLSKRLLNNSFASSYEEMIEDEGRCQHILFSGKDMREAMIAYVQKRDPNFVGY